MLWERHLVRGHIIKSFMEKAIACMWLLYISVDYNSFDQIAKWRPTYNRWRMHRKAEPRPDKFPSFKFMTDT